MPPRKPAAKTQPPADISPMLCTLVDEPFNNPDFFYELKLDGYRIVSIVTNGHVRMETRKHENYVSKWPPLAEALAALGHNAVIDGEVVAIDENGHPSFNLLQKYRQVKSELAYYCFDLLWLDGKDLRGKPIEQRKATLAEILPAGDVLRYSHEFDDGVALYNQVVSMGLEGIVGKRRGSLYTSGRSKNWLKVPIVYQREYVIGGWAESSSGRSYANLLLGEYRDGKFYYVHHSGAGLSDRQTSALAAALKKIEVKRSPFVNAKDVDVDTPVHWVKPLIVGTFKQSNKRTSSGRIRHPVILVGLRDDKPPEEVTPD